MKKSVDDSKALKKYIVIGVVILIVVLLGFYFMRALSNKSSSKVKESELGTFGPGGGPTDMESESMTIEGGKKPCDSDSDCEDCVQSCINKECTINGKTLCDSTTPGAGKCVTDSKECDCSDRCEPCTEFCLIRPGDNDGTCQPSGEIYCPDGFCATPAGCVTHTECAPPNEDACEDICQTCYNERCETVPGIIECGNGVCVPQGQLCPGDCDPPCTPCVEECRVSNGQRRCFATGKIVCSDGSCRESQFDCTKLFPKIYPSRDPQVIIREF